MIGTQRSTPLVILSTCRWASTKFHALANGFVSALIDFVVRRRSLRRCAWSSCTRTRIGTRGERSSLMRDVISCDMRHVLPCAASAVSRTHARPLGASALLHSAACVACSHEAKLATSLTLPIGPRLAAVWAGWSTGARTVGTHCLMTSSRRPVKASTRVACAVFIARTWRALSASNR